MGNPLRRSFHIPFHSAARCGSPAPTGQGRQVILLHGRVRPGQGGGRKTGLPAKITGAVPSCPLPVLSCGRREERALPKEKQAGQDPGEGGY